MCVRSCRTQNSMVDFGPELVKHERDRVMHNVKPPIVQLVPMMRLGLLMSPSCAEQNSALVKNDQNNNEFKRRLNPSWRTRTLSEVVDGSKISAQFDTVPD